VDHRVYVTTVKKRNILCLCRESNPGFPVSLIRLLIEPAVSFKMLMGHGYKEKAAVQLGTVAWAV
jgi:hypothetical protein